MIERAHLKVEIEETKSGTEILKRIVGVLVASDLVQAVAELNGLMNIVIARVNSFRLSGIVLGASNRRKEHSRDKNGGRNAANRHASFHRFVLPRPKIQSPDRRLLGLRTFSMNEIEPAACSI